MGTWSHEHRQIDWVNRYVKESPEEFVARSEARYREQIEHVAEQILTEGTCRFLLISGPSASTKTTTSEKLAERFKAGGYAPQVISTDNFFCNNEELPILENGERDFESFETLDVAEMRRCLSDLLQRGEAEFPIFDFHQGRRAQERETIRFGEKSILLIEGIHTLNPEMGIRGEEGTVKKLYVSPNTNYYDGPHCLLSWRDIRLIRRMVRDYFHRGHDLEKTLDLWDNVVENEEKSIIPYRTSADYTIDTAITYEPCIYGAYLNRMLEQCEVSMENRALLRRMEKGLRVFAPLSPDKIPADTVLREFLE